MIRNVGVLLIATVLTFSCSSDKSDEEMQDATAIVGTWQATELKINNETASDDAKFGKQILDFLTAKDCYILTFTFNEDLTVIAKDAVNYIEINATSSGLDIPCPVDMDTDAGTYSYDGKVLTYVNGDDETATINVTIDGTVMSIDATQLDIPNFNDEGELIFKKK